MFEFGFNRQNQSTRSTIKKEQRVWIRTQLGLLRKEFVTGVRLPHCLLSTQTETPALAWQATFFLSTAGDGVMLVDFLPQSLKHITKCSPILTATFLQLKAFPVCCPLGESWHWTLNSEASFMWQKRVLFLKYISGLKYLYLKAFFSLHLHYFEIYFFILKCIFFHGNDIISLISFKKRLCRTLLYGARIYLANFLQLDI